MFVQSMHQKYAAAMERRDFNSSKVFALLSALIVFLSALILVVQPPGFSKHGHKVMYSRVATNGTVATNDTHSDATGMQKSCTWAPGEDKDCQRAIRALVCRKEENDATSLLPRFLLFGDSTMNRLYKWGNLRDPLQHRKYFVIRRRHELACNTTERKDPQCDLNSQYDIEYPENLTWIPPAPESFAGPVAFGLQNPYCQDCKGCGASLLECRALSGKKLNVSSMNVSQRMDLIYGGYIGSEFARDVEMQSTLFPTTQENIAYYLNRTWNEGSGMLTAGWEKPTCLVNSGHHDAVIPNITQEIYVSNVQWYLHLLADQCRSILWLATTAPLSNNYTQKVETTRAWGEGVRDMMSQDAILANVSLYIDLFESSHHFPHNDNIHMTREWYEALANLFLPENMFAC